MFTPSFFFPQALFLAFILHIFRLSWTGRIIMPWYGYRVCDGSQWHQDPLIWLHSMWRGQDDIKTHDMATQYVMGSQWHQDPWYGYTVYDGVTMPSGPMIWLHSMWQVMIASGLMICLHSMWWVMMTLGPMMWWHSMGWDYDDIRTCDMVTHYGMGSQWHQDMWYGYTVWDGITMTSGYMIWLYSICWDHNDIRTLDMAIHYVIWS